MTTSKFFFKFLNSIILLSFLDIYFVSRIILTLKLNLLIKILVSFNRFIHADIGMNGRMSDGGVWSRSKFQEELNSDKLNLPSADPFPFHIVGDNAFPLSCKLMKPYAQISLENCVEKRIFNYRLHYLYLNSFISKKYSQKRQK